MPGKKQPDGKPEFADIEEELLQCLGPESGKLLDFAGYREEAGASLEAWKVTTKRLIVRLSAERPIGDLARGDQLNDLVVEVDELLGILASAAFARIFQPSPYSVIVKELRTAKGRPQFYASHKPDFSAETKTLIGRQLLKQKKNRNLSAVFELDAAPRDNKGRVRNLGYIGKAAAVALNELLAAHENFSKGREGIDPVLRPFLEKPIHSTNQILASALRKWLTKVGKKPTRVTEGKETRSSADEFLRIILPPVNGIIERFSGKTYSRDTLKREMSKVPESKK